MPSSYTTSGVELIGDGEQSGTWGGTTNTNLQIIDRMVSQAGTIALSGTTHTLTISDGVLSDGQYGVLVFGGSPSGTNTVTISPNDARRTYIVKNDSGQTVILTQGSGGDVSVANGKTAIVYCDGAGSGAAVVDLTATLAVTALTLSDLGVTASASELNTLDGITATTAELNILDGVTATASELNILDGVTATASELNILDGVTATASELNILDGATLTTTELNFVDGVTSSIQTQLNAKAANTTQAEATWEAGTSTTETIVSPAKIKSAIAALSTGPSVYRSSQISIANNGEYAFTHGLGSSPDIVQVYLVCTSPDAGYEVGEVIQVVPSSEIDGENEGFGLKIDTSQVTVYVGQNGPGQYTNENVGFYGRDGTSLTAADWDLYIVAVKFA